MNLWDKFLESYYYYRIHVGCNVPYAFYRACYYEAFHKEPKKWRGVPL